MYMYICIYIYIYIYPPAPQGHTVAKIVLFSPRILAISSSYYLSVLLVSGSVFSVLLI